jgi:cellulose synthase (UDP-forming)
MNVLWCLFNVVILGVCTAVAREMKQVRTTVRIKVALPVMARAAGGRPAARRDHRHVSRRRQHSLSRALRAGPAGRGPARIFPPRRAAELPGTVVSSEGSVLRVRFPELSIAEQEVLTMVLYSRADSWLGWGEARESDNVLRSLGRIFHISCMGLMQTLRSLIGKSDKPLVKKVNTLSMVRPAAILLVVAMLAGLANSVRAQQPARAKASPPRSLPASAGVNGTANTGGPEPGKYRDLFTLKDAGSPQIELHGVESRSEVRFTLPQTHVVRSAKIHVNYVFSPSLLPQMSHLNLLMNGAVFATIQPKPGLLSGSDPLEAAAEFDLPPELLVHSNRLTFELVGHYTLTCENPANTALWARVLRSSYLDVEGDELPLADDVKQLPMPFLDQPANEPLSVPIVFASAPDLKAIQAAGVVASYFGLVAEGKPVRFPVSIGQIPQGNAVVIVDSAGDLPPGLKLGGVNAAAGGHAQQPQRPVRQSAGGCRRDSPADAHRRAGRGHARRHAQRAGHTDRHLQAARGAQAR